MIKPSEIWSFCLLLGGLVFWCPTCCAQDSKIDLDNSSLLISPVPEQVDFRPYIAELQKKIKGLWRPVKSGESFRVTLVFSIAADGHLVSARVQSASSPYQNEAALNAVRAAAPFSPLPAGCKQDVGVEFTFNYSVYKKGPVDKSNTEAELALLSRAIALTPENGELYFRRGQWYAAESQLDKALADFEQAIELLPGDKRCTLERERVVEKLGGRK